MTGSGDIGAREIFERIYLAIMGLVIFSMFIPCNEVIVVTDNVPKAHTSAIFDSHVGIIALIVAVAAVIFILKGKRIASSVSGILVSALAGVTILFFVDTGKSAQAVTEGGDSAWKTMMEYGGITSVTNRHTIGYYVASVALIVLLIAAVAGFFIKDSD